MPRAPAYSAPRLSVSDGHRDRPAPSWRRPASARRTPGRASPRASARRRPTCAGPPAPCPAARRRAARGDARPDAVDLDPVAVREAAEGQEVVVRGARQPVDRHVDAVRSGLDRDTDEILVRHRLRLQGQPIRIGYEPGPEPRLAGLALAAPDPRTADQGRTPAAGGGRGDSGTGGGEKSAAVEEAALIGSRAYPNTDSEPSTKDVRARTPGGPRAEAPPSGIMEARCRIRLGVLRRR